MKNSLNRLLLSLLVACGLLVGGCSADQPELPDQTITEEDTAKNPSSDLSESSDISDPKRPDLTLADIPPYQDELSVIIHENKPFFTEQQLEEGADSFEIYYGLDSLNRVIGAFASIGQDLMPTERRGDISKIKPTGWVQNAYDFIKDGPQLYNRSHLIAYSLSAENANEANLMTGTRAFNAHGMEPYERMVKDYVDQTDNHVLYRVTPFFEGDNLVANGVLLEAESVEDHGEGVQFCVFVYNVQPGVEIDYATGENHEAAHHDDDHHDAASQTSTDSEKAAKKYVLNTRSMIFHAPECESVSKMKAKNRQDVTANREDLIEQGYTPCANCHP